MRERFRQADRGGGFREPSGPLPLPRHGGDIGVFAKRQCVGVTSLIAIGAKHGVLPVPEDYRLPPKRRRVGRHRAILLISYLDLADVNGLQF